MTAPAPVSASLIVKNERNKIEHCLKSLRPYVKQIIVVDTGSTDGTVEVAKQLADFVEVYTECNDPATGLINRFDLARNRSLSHVT